MTKEEFLEGMTLLGVAYNKEFTQEQVSVWYSMLGEYSKEEFREAIKELIKTEEYLPSIAKVTNQIAERKTSNLPNAEDEWNEVLNVVHRYGSYRQQEAMEHLKPYTAYITRHIGYQNICMSEDNTWNRKEFIEEYNSMKEHEKELIQIGSKASSFTRNQLATSVFTKI